MEVPELVERERGQHPQHASGKKENERRQDIPDTNVRLINHPKPADKAGGRLPSTREFVESLVVAVILATTLAALLVSAVALLTYQASNYRAFLLSDATTQGGILARMAAPAPHQQVSPHRAASAVKTVLTLDSLVNWIQHAASGLLPAYSTADSRATTARWSLAPTSRTAAASTV